MVERHVANVNVEGSTPFSRSKPFSARSSVVEHHVDIVGVVGSNPAVRTITKPDYILITDDGDRPIFGSDFHALVTAEFPYQMSKEIRDSIPPRNLQTLKMTDLFGERQYVEAGNDDRAVLQKKLKRREGEALWEFYSTYYFRYERDLVMAVLALRGS